MKCRAFLMILAQLISLSVLAQIRKSPDFGRFSLGTRNTVSAFNDESGTGVGIGGQFRILISPRINTEWYLDYISSDGPANAARRDYHIGWSVLYYPGKKTGFDTFLKPYLIAGHCFDRSEMAWTSEIHAPVITYSMATQAGLGNHFNITPELDCSVSAQYMLHFGRHAHVEEEAGEIVAERERFGKSVGHLLFTVSFNYVFIH